MVLQTQVKVNNVDVTSDLISYEYESSYGQVVTILELDFVKSITDSVTLVAGQTVEVWRGWTTPTDNKIFSGYIEKYEPKGGKIKIVSKDKSWDLIKKEVNHVYDYQVDASAGKISEIFKDLVTTYGELTADSNSIQDSGTTYILQKFICNRADIFERCRRLAETLDWQFYYRADTDKVYFEPKGYEANTNTLTVGTEIIQVPHWDYDTTEMINKITIVGAYQEVETTESGQIGSTTGYTTTGIDIYFSPISVKFYIDASDPPTTLKVGGVPGSTSAYDYYVDKNRKKILPAPGTTFTNNHYAEIRYSYAAPIPVELVDEDSQNTYGKFTKTITFTDIRTVEDAENRAYNILSQHSRPDVSSTLKIRSQDYSIRVGQKIRIIDNISDPAVDDWFTIVSHTIKYPGNYEEIQVGIGIRMLSEWQARVEEKFKRLEEEEMENPDIVIKIQSIDNTDKPIKEPPRYRWVTTETYNAGNARFILDSPEHGILGTNKLAGAYNEAFGSEVDHFIQQYQDTYTEEIVDNDFKDTGGTATWDTTNNEITFTSGQIAKSLSIDYNNSTITTAKMTVTKSSGTFLYEMTADGTNWETVTSGTAHTFTNTGTDLRWRITEDAAGTGTVTQIIVEDYH